RDVPLSTAELVNFEWTSYERECSRLISNSILVNKANCTQFRVQLAPQDFNSFPLLNTTCTMEFSGKLGQLTLILRGQRGYDASDFCRIFVPEEISVEVDVFT